MKYQTSDLETN